VVEVIVIILALAFRLRRFLPGLDCFELGSNPKFLATSLVPNRADRVFQEPFTNTADHIRQSPMQLHNLAPMPFLLPLFRKFFFPHPVINVWTAVVLDENFGKEFNSTNVAQ
jgi:hypothetical protein